MSKILSITYEPKFKEILQPMYEFKPKTSNIGFDLYLPSDILIKPNETRFINLGISCKYHDEEGKRYGFQLFARNAILKTKVRLVNSAAFFDDKYEGPIVVAVDNISDEYQLLKFGEKYFQLVFIRTEKPIVNYNK